MSNDQRGGSSNPTTSDSVVSFPQGPILLPMGLALALALFGTMTEVESGFISL